ncbi:hypothetical protein CYY_004681 [Polysphondylium violaceum]|uniref:Cytochrome P450 family protein n=1 Tax=Polysphondylium violaceum TaxID=133409 RepID=A0A8J4PUW4_9MYCE|nr:hypothetical protein CYY_004681 [Polysphondylium violaceum]
MIITIAFIVLIFLLTRFLKSQQQSREYVNLPPGPTPLPLLGNLLSLVKDSHISISKLAKKYGGAMTLYLGNVRTIVISDPNLIKQVFVNQSQDSTNRFILETAKIIGNGKNILFSNGDYWKQYRLVLSRSFMRLKTHSIMTDKINKEAEYFSNSFKSNPIIDPAHFCKIFTSNVMMEMLFNDRSKYSNTETHKIIEAIKNVEHGLAVGSSFDALPFLKLFFPNARKDLIKTLEDVWEYSKESIVNHQNSLAKDENQINDFLDLLLTEIKGSGNESFYDMEGLYRVCSDLLISGTETSASTMTWLILYMINNKDIQMKARKELQDAMGDKKYLTMEDKSKTPFFNACIKEVLRIAPVGALSLPREATADLEVGGYLIPKDSQLIMNVYGLATNAELWSDPLIFNPNRWLSEDQEMSNYQYIPFGIGSRACIGSSLAKDEIFLGVGNLLLNYEIDSENGKPLTEKGNFGIALCSQPYQAKFTPLVI